MNFSEAVKGIDFDERVLETECIEELEEVLEEFDMNEEMNLHSQDVLQVGKTKQDAENLAIELLATRLVFILQDIYEFGCYLLILKCDITGAQY